MRLAELAVSSLLFSSVVITQSQGEEALTGTVRLACEAILCLSTGSPPGECSPSLNYYFDIRARKFSDTLKKRRNFLNLCPSSDEPEMPSLVEAIVQGAGRCEASYLIPRLNRFEERGCYSEGFSPFYGACLSSVPSYCKAYAAHPYTLIDTPVRVKTCTGYSGYDDGLPRCTYHWVVKP